MKKAIVLVTASLLGGCTAPMVDYNWGAYESSLYGYYKNPVGEEQLAESLAEVVKGDDPYSKVPPGLYAEYGFLLLKMGKGEEARTWFQKEQEHWPESGVFMQTLMKDTPPPQTAGK